MQNNLQKYGTSTRCKDLKKKTKIEYSNARAISTWERVFRYS